MNSICGANCAECSFSGSCRGCEKTGGCPFGGRCIAASYILVGGKDAYLSFKKQLKEEIDRLLRSLGLPESKALHELPGDFVNLAYALPNGTGVQFLDGKNIYLGTQIEYIDGRCIGVVADTTFILICSYGENGCDPELILYKKR